MVLLSTASIAAAQEDARFVSLTPDIFREADASEIMDNVEALGGAQFFWAFPEQGSKGNLHLPSLVGAKMGIVHPYQITEKEEKEGKEIRFCWGRLENLLYTSEIPKEAEYWVRPTTSLFAIQSPCRYDEKQEKGKKLHLNFRDYHYFLDANKGNKDSFASVYNTMGEHEKKAMNIQDPFRGKPKGENDKPGMYGNLDFNSCPWGDMLERRKTKVNESADIKYVTDYLTSLASLAKEKKLDKNSKWMNYWSVTSGAGSRRDYGKRKELLPYWRDEPYQILNKTKGSFDGWLCLKDYTTFKWDCAKIEQTATSFNFLPLSGHVAKFSASGTIEQKPDRELRAVVASVSHRQEDRPGFVVAILADWDRSASQVDAITVNQCFNPNGGTIKSDKSDCSVRVPEYTRVALHKDATDENTGFLNVTFNEQKIAQVSWQGGKVLRLLNEEILTQSPIVYEANCKNREIKAVVALPAETAEEIINSRGIEALALSDIRGESFMDGNNTAAWAKCSPVNMSQSWEMIEDKELAHDIKLLNSTSNSPNGQNGKVLEGYNLYLVTMSFDSTCPRIAAGEMYNEWHFTSSKTSDKLSLPTVTNLCKVYTIFGESTWPKSGEVVLGKSKPQQENAILPWERMLNYVTRLCLCDKNTYAQSISWNQKNPLSKSNAIAAITHGIRNTSVYPPEPQNSTVNCNNITFINTIYNTKKHNKNTNR